MEVKFYLCYYRTDLIIAQYYSGHKWRRNKCLCSCQHCILFCI